MSSYFFGSLCCYICLLIYLYETIIYKYMYLDLSLLQTCIFSFFYNDANLSQTRIGTLATFNFYTPHN